MSLPGRPWHGLRAELWRISERTTSCWYLRLTLEKICTRFWLPQPSTAAARRTPYAAPQCSMQCVQAWRCSLMYWHTATCRAGGKHLADVAIDGIHGLLNRGGKTWQLHCVFRWRVWPAYPVRGCLCSHVCQHQVLGLWPLQACCKRVSHRIHSRAQHTVVLITLFRMPATSLYSGTGQH
jgi:hypothetical protein